MSKKSDQPPKHRLEFTTHAALGMVSRELAWQVKDLVQQPIEYRFEESEYIRLKSNLLGHPTDLIEILELMNPVRECNELQCVNPQLNMKSLMSENPLCVLLAVLNIFTVSDHYLAPPDQRQPLA